MFRLSTGVALISAALLRPAFAANPPAGAGACGPDGCCEPQSASAASLDFSAFSKLTALSSLPALTVAPAPPKAALPGLVVTREAFTSYGEAYRRAVADGKPLLVWVGDSFCARCVRENAEEFVHCRQETFPGAAARSIVVAVPDGDGLTRVGDVSWWITGDREFGHVPSARRAIRLWLDRSAVQQGYRPPTLFRQSGMMSVR